MRRTFLLGLLVLLAAAPAAEARRSVPQGFYGVFWGGGARSAPEAAQDAQWAAMARSGVESVRTVFSWAGAQPSGPGQTDHSETDRIVTRAVRSGIRPLPVVIDTPGWVAKKPFEEGSPPSQPEHYAAYLQLLVQRYGPSGSFWSEHPELPHRPLREWQVWNEPELRAYWNEDDWPGGYARLLEAAHDAVKLADPGAKVVLAALADYAWRHLAKLNREGIRGKFDVAALNFFTGSPSNVVRGVSKFRRELVRGREGRVPIYVTETTFPASKGRNRARRRATWEKAWETTDRGMARDLTETYRLLARARRRLRVGSVYWYTWASGYRPSSFFEYGGLLRLEGTRFRPRPALAAYRASARRHQGCAKTSAGRCR